MSEAFQNVGDHEVGCPCPLVWKQKSWQREEVVNRSTEVERRRAVESWTELGIFGNEKNGMEDTVGFRKKQVCWLTSFFFGSGMDGA